MIGNGDQLFSDSKLEMMSEIYEVNSWVEIFGYADVAARLKAL